MDLFKKLIVFLQDEKEKIKNIMNSINVEKLAFSDSLERLYFISKLCEADISSVNVDELKELLKSVGDTTVTEEDLNNFEEVKKIVKYLYNPQVPNVGVKKEKITFVNEFKKKIKNICYEVSIKIEKYEDSLNENRDLIKKIECYLSNINKNDFISDMTYSELNEFYSFLENSLINKGVVFDIIARITIDRLSLIEKTYEKESNSLLLDESVYEEIESNSRNILEQNVIQISEDVIDTSMFSEEEQKIFENINKIMDEKDNKLSIFDNIIKDMFNDFSLESRKEIYYVDDIIDWDIVVADFNLNLLSNIQIHKDEIFTIFRFILGLENGFLDNNEFVSENINDYILEFKNIIKTANDMIEDLNDLNSDLSMDKVDEINLLVGEINELSNEILVKINDDNIDCLELKNVNDRLLDLISKIDMLRDNDEICNVEDNIFVDVVNENNNDIDENIFIDIVNENNNNVEDNIFVDTNNEDSKKIVSEKLESKTLLLFLKGDNGEFEYFNQMKDIVEHGKYDLLMSGFKNAVRILSNNNISDIKNKNFNLNVDGNMLVDNTVLFNDYLGFDFDKFKFDDGIETGYIYISVNEENKKKIIDAYGDNNLEYNLDTIILVITSIMDTDNNLEYSVFKEIVADNYNYISYIVNLFGKEDTNVDELMNVISLNIDEYKKINDIC